MSERATPTAEGDDLVTMSRLFLTVTAFLALGLVVYDSPLAQATPAPPSPTLSWYIRTVDGATLYDMGCLSGREAHNGVLILDFGQAWLEGSTYGSIIFDPYNSFASISQIEEATKAFLTGYWNCTPSWTYITVVIGTSNYHGYTTSGHGQAWAQMVNRINDWITSPAGYASQEAVVGGNDMELSWNSAAATRSWAQGYASAGLWPYYNFGACEGCPTKDYWWWVPNNGWTLEDVWFVSWGVANAWPLPEIYLESGINADQWQYLSRWSAVNHSQRMTSKGALSQWAAAGLCCTNTPAQAWMQLWNSLNADPLTAQDLSWSTDISWNTVWSTPKITAVSDAATSALCDSGGNCVANSALSVTGSNLSTGSATASSCGPSAPLTLENTSAMVDDVNVPICRVSSDQVKFWFGAFPPGTHTLVVVREDLASPGFSFTSRLPAWYFAEGWTGSGWLTFIPMMNPNATAANVTATFMLEGGGSVVKSYV
ncbi:MAG: hypothetical protein HY677_03750, partial [Chloroflexi bacterium]|nr:hypothetical protein [Chloroflexota bacterium]